MKIIDHAYESEDVIIANLSKIKKALEKNEEVIVYHSEGFIHKRLANIPNVKYKLDKSLPKRKDLAVKLFTPSNETVNLLKLWGLPIWNKCNRIKPKWNSKRIAYIHWMLCEDNLQPIELFHLNMLWLFNAANFFDEIHIRVANDGNIPFYVSNVLNEVLGNGKAKLDIKGVINSNTWEWNTYNEFLNSAKEDADMYYMHFKGVSHIPGSVRNKKTTFYDYGNFKGITFWSYLMYIAMFTLPLTDLKPAVCGILHKNPEWTKKIGWTYNDYHAAGSFQAYNGKELLSNKNFIDKQLNIAKKDINCMRYIVEGMMTILFNKNKINCLIDVSNKWFGIYENFEKVVPEYYKEFYKGPINVINTYQQIYDPNCRNICVANGTYKYIGGTDTFNWALCKAFIDLGYTVYYYSPNMDGNGITEKYLKEIGVLPYKWGTSLTACFANQQTGKEFIGYCPVIQTCHSKWTKLEYPIDGAKAYVSISEEIHDYIKELGYKSVLLRNGEDLKRFSSKNNLRNKNDKPQVLSICQGDDTLIKEACKKLGWTFKNVPKEVENRIWHIEDLINESDIVIGIGRSLYDGMACGRACISWDNRNLNPYTGCGYINKENWYKCACTNFTGRGFPKIDTVDKLVSELLKYNPDDGLIMRKFAEKELNAKKNAIKYLELAGIKNKED